VSFYNFVWVVGKIYRGLILAEFMKNITDQVIFLCMALPIIFFGLIFKKSGDLRIIGIALLVAIIVNFCNEFVKSDLHWITKLIKRKKKEKRKNKIIRKD
jgi:hypothetical protein